MPAAFGCASTPFTHNYGPFVKTGCCQDYNACVGKFTSSSCHSDRPHASFLRRRSPDYDQRTATRPSTSAIMLSVIVQVKPVRLFSRLHPGQTVSLARRGSDVSELLRHSNGSSGQRLGAASSTVQIRPLVNVVARLLTHHAELVVSISPMIQAIVVHVATFAGPTYARVVSVVIAVILIVGIFVLLLNNRTGVEPLRRLKSSSRTRRRIMFEIRGNSSSLNTMSSSQCLKRAFDHFLVNGPNGP